MHEIDNPDGLPAVSPDGGLRAAWWEAQVASGSGEPLTSGRLPPVLTNDSRSPVQTVAVKPSSETPRIVEGLLPGRVLRSRYRIESCLGAGGKGTVFRARDLFRKSLPEADQYVALKVLHGGHDALDDVMEQIRRELHCAQALSHTNIVNVYELDRDDDVVFFTMELLEGELLSKVLAQHRPAPIDRNQAWQMIRQIGAGLQHAHERGVVHGDLKPANIMVTRAGELRILDFGSSKRFIPGETATAASGRSSATLAYASCEQLAGRPADPRDDLYAFACICFELLAGSHPFDRRPASLVRDFGVIPKRPAGLTARQWRTLQRGVSWHRAGRSMSVHTFVQCLGRDRDDEPRLTPLGELKSWTPRHPEWQTRAPVLVMAVLLAVGACVTQWGATPGPQSLASAPATAAQAAEADATETYAGTVPASVERAWAAPDRDPEPEAAAPARPSPRHGPLVVAVEGYHVGTGDRFVEIRVARNLANKNGSFVWWTEAATAQQGVDYVTQGRAIQTFGDERRSTRLYVKLLPDTQRSQRDYFYLAIAQPGSKRPDAVTRTQIWLPIPRGQLQAQR